MALIECPECGKKISDKAQLCIGCGCPMEIIVQMINEHKTKTQENLQEQKSKESEEKQNLSKRLREEKINGILLDTQQLCEDIQPKLDALEKKGVKIFNDLGDSFNANQNYVDAKKWYGIAATLDRSEFVDKIFQVNQAQQLQAKTQKLLSESGFIKGKTYLYCRLKAGNEISRGTFLRFDHIDNRDVVVVSFDGKEATFGYPKCMGVLLYKSLQEAKDRGFKPNVEENLLTQNILNEIGNFSPAIMPDSNQKTEMEREQEYFEKVEETAKNARTEVEKEYSVLQESYAYLESEDKEEYIRRCQQARENGYWDWFLSPTNERERNKNINQQRIAREKISLWGSIIKEPYFVRLDLGDRKKGIRSVYLGKNKVQDYVLDWRDAQVGAVYYQTELFKNHPEIILKLKRAFHIEYAKFLGYTDEYNGYNVETNNISPDKISDLLFERLLSESRQKKEIHDIIRTIQSNQYEMITANFNQNVLINGCAGSGKTMILYHRLSYIAYNDRYIEPKNMIAIIPNQLFLNQTEQLIEDLHLKDIQNTTYSQLLLTIIDQYIQKNKLLVYKKIDRSLMQEISYPSEHYKADALTEILSYIQNVSHEDFIKDQVEKINADLRKWASGYYKPGIEIEDLTRPNKINRLLNGEYLGRYYRQYMSIKIALAAYSEANVNAYLQRHSTSKSDGPAKTVKKLFYENRERILPHMGATKYTKDGNISSQLNEKIFSSAEEDFEAEKPKTFLEALEQLDVFFEFRPLFERLLSFQKYALGNEKPFALEYAKYILEIYKKRHNLESENLTFDLVVILYVLSQKLGKINDEKTYLFIDEFQNYSHLEINVLQQCFGRPIFNFFGDFDQKLEEKGFLDETDVQKIVNTQVYKISENYRNAKEITEFINDKLYKEMLPIGLHGSVEEIPLSTVGFEIDGRTAVIVKNPTEMKEKIKYNRGAYLLSYETDNKHIYRGDIIVLTPAQAKGLEFETVYVYNQGMTEHEKYVAYTRALSKLIVMH